jgi:phenylacetate-CoA ligase
VCAERVLIEIVDAAGLPVPPGVSGRVVITPFYNTAQPLIRYDQGDMATFGPPCDCGRNLPVLHSLDGRVVHMFRHPDGRRRTRGFPEKYHQTLDARMWQFAQVGPLDFEIRYVPVDPDRRGNEAEVATAFREWFFDDAKIVFKRLDAIPLTASGKYMEYLYEADETLAR